LHKRYIENAEEKLEAAEYLLEGGFCNDAVSRAYYSMFYSARALLSLKEIYPKAHKGVISKFGLEFVKKGFVEDAYGRALSHAKDRREVADYDIEKNIRMIMAWNSITLMQKVTAGDTVGEAHRNSDTTATSKY